MTREDATFPALVSTEWLAARLDDPLVRPVDASWYMAATGRDAAAEYAAAHIRGAVRFDLTAASDPGSNLPHMLPSAEDFGELASRLGLRDDHTIVVYDASGVNLSAPRAWWMFRAFGHGRTAVLDGGLGKWRREGRPIETGIAPAARGEFSAVLDAARVFDAATVLASIGTATQIVDARSAARFRGTEPEPRPGLRAGHIPGSRSVPYESLVGGDGTMLPSDELERLLESAGVDPARPMIATCGSGVTACAVALALEVIGHPVLGVYDGSWTEWGGRADLPLETGDAGDVGHGDETHHVR